MKYEIGTLFINKTQDKKESLFSHTEDSAKYIFISDIIPDVYSRPNYKIKFSKTTVPSYKSNHVYYYYDEDDLQHALLTKKYKISIIDKLKNL